MQFNEYLLPVDKESEQFSFISSHDDCLGKHIVTGPFAEELKDTDMAIIGVNETRGAFENYNSDGSAEAFRTQFYKLKKHDGICRIVDLGDLKPGKTREDTYFGLATIIADLISRKIIPVIIGGSQDLTFAHYLAYKNLSQVINMATVDSRFDLGKPEEELSSQSYLGKIILQKPNFLFNFSCIGYQTYFVGQHAIEMMSRLYFDTYRLGAVKTDLAEMEPVIRNADLLSFDFSSIRYSDSPAGSSPSPNGFNGEEACQLMMYAGMSDKMNGLGLYEYVPAKDRDQQTASLMAQMVWYFAEGFINRKRDLPAPGKNSFVTYRVTVSGNDRELIFLKSKKSDKWWMEFAMPDGKNLQTKQIYIPCSYKDYQMACNDELPERWWQTLQKIS